MKKYFALVKLFFTQQYKMRSAVGSKDKKHIGWIFTVVVIILGLLPFAISVAVAMFYMGQISQGNEYVNAFLILMCQGLVLMFGVHAIISNVFIVGDAERLGYLPVRSLTVFLAKFTVTYLNEVITTAVTLCFIVLPFGIGASASAAFYCTLPFALLLIPVLPLFVGTVVAMPLSALMAAVGKNGTLKTVVRVLMYLAVMALYMYVMYNFGFFSGSENNILDNPQEYIAEMIDGFINRLQGIVVYVHSDYMLSCAMLSGSFGGRIGSIAASIGENLLMLAIVMVMALPFYNTIVRQSLESGGIARRKSKNAVANSQSLKLRNKGSLLQLIITDFKRTVRDGQLGFQSFAGLVMLPVTIVIFYFMLGQASDGDASFLEVMSISPMYQIIAPLVVLGYTGMLSVITNVWGLYPITRENTSFYLLKSLPVSFNKILLAKVILATAVMSVCDFITCLLIVLLLGIKWYYGIAIFVTMALIGFGAMCITTLLDLKSPKFRWANFNQGLNNAKNHWYAILISMLLDLAIALASTPFLIWCYATSNAQDVAPMWYIPFLMWLLLLVISFAFAMVAYKVMARKASGYFNRIET